MKAILVIDMPNHCSNCSCWDRDYPVCCVLNKENKSKDYGHRPKWCPLKPIPEYKDEHFRSFSIELDGIINSENRGWNACIDEILGGRR